MAHEAAGPEMLQGTRAVPRPLAFRVEGVARRIERNAAGTAQPAAHRFPAAVGKMTQRPPAKESLGGVAVRETMDGPDRAVAVEAGPERELMLAAPGPRIAHRFETISALIAISVPQPRDFALLRGVKHAIPPSEPEDFGQARGEQFPNRSRGRGVRSSGEIDFAAPRPDHEPPIRQPEYAAGLQHRVGRHRYVADAVELRLAFIHGHVREIVRAEVLLQIGGRRAAPIAAEVALPRRIGSHVVNVGLGRDRGFQSDAPVAGVDEQAPDAFLLEIVAVTQGGGEDAGRLAGRAREGLDPRHGHGRFSRVRFVIGL